MAVTCAQDASTIQAGGHPLQAEQSKANLFTPPAPSPPQPQIPQTDPLAALAQQVHELTAVVQGLQEQYSTATPLPPQPPSVKAEGPCVDHSHNGRSPPLELRHSAPSRSRHWETSKRSRSPSHRSNSPHKRRSEKKPERRPQRHHHHFYSSSESSKGDSFDRRVARRAERRLDEHHQRLEELSRRIFNPQGMDYECRPPLSHRIMEEPIPPRFRLPQLDPYDGTTDPLDHLESYKVLMQVQGATNALLCIAFPATLRKAAPAWYSRLSLRSINSFRQLGRSFLAHFDACRKIPREADSLFTVQQRSSESLKDNGVLFSIY